MIVAIVRIGTQILFQVSAKITSLFAQIGRAGNGAGSIKSEYHFDGGLHVDRLTVLHVRPV